VKLKPNCADAYAGKLQVGRQYQALFSLENAKYMSIVGTEITHALKAHFDIRLT
jgi:predicted porin